MSGNVPNGHAPTPPDFPYAACKRIQVMQFFDPRLPGEKPDEARSRQAVAKTICGTCRHLGECQDWGLRVHFDHPQDNGPVIGGLTDEERIAVRQAEGIPTPRRLAHPTVRKCGHLNDPDARSSGDCPACRAKKRAEHSRRAARARLERERQAS